MNEGGHSAGGASKDGKNGMNESQRSRFYKKKWFVGYWGQAKPHSPPDLSTWGIKGWGGRIFG